MEGFTSCWGMTVAKAILKVLTVLQELNVCGRKSPNGVQVGFLDKVPQKLKQNVKLMYNF